MRHWQTIKRHCQALQQDLLYEPWTFFSQNRGSLVARVPCPSVENVFYQEFRSILLPLIDDATLGPVRVGVVGISRARDDSDRHPGVSQSQGYRASGHATADNEHIGFNQFRHATSFT